MFLLTFGRQERVVHITGRARRNLKAGEVCHGFRPLRVNVDAPKIWKKDHEFIDLGKFYRNDL